MGVSVFFVSRDLSQISVLVMVQVTHLPVHVAGTVAGGVGDVQGHQAGREAVIQRVDAAEAEYEKY